MSENEKNTNIGNIKISDDVVATIAGIAAGEVNGVSSMSSGLVDGISEFLGKKSASKGIKVSIGEDNVDIELFLIVNYGVKIPDVAWEVQENVKKAVETMTGLFVTKIDVRVDGIRFPAEEKPSAPKTEGEADGADE